MENLILCHGTPGLNLTLIYKSSKLKLKLKSDSNIMIFIFHRAGLGLFLSCSTQLILGFLVHYCPSVFPTRFLFDFSFFKFSNKLK